MVQELYFGEMSSILNEIRVPFILNPTQTCLSAWVGLNFET